MIIAHRGWSAKYPENTLEAFRAAITVPRSRVIEFDVRKTKDDVPIILHDSTLDRTSTGKGSVINCTWEDLQSVSIKGSNQKIPSLHDVFSEFKNDIGYDVEIKTKDTAKLVVDEIIRSGISYENVLVTSFKWDEIEAVRRLDPSILTGLISVIRPERAIRKCVHLGCPVVVLNHRVITKDVMRYADECGIDVYAYTVNDRDIMQKLVGYGVKAIVTDNPDII